MATWKLLFYGFGAVIVAFVAIMASVFGLPDAARVERDLAWRLVQRLLPVAFVAIPATIVVAFILNFTTHAAWTPRLLGLSVLLSLALAATMLFLPRQ